MSDRPEARRALHHHADRSALLALDADAVGRDRRLAAGEKRGNHLEELRLVDRAALQFEIDRNVGRNRRRCRERADVFGRGINGGDELVHVGEIAQSLNAAVRGAGADGDQVLRLPPYLANALGIVLGGDRALDQRQIVGAILHGARRFQEIGDLDRAGEARAARPRNQAARAGSRRRRRISRPQGEARLIGRPCQISRTAKMSAIRSNRITGPSLQMKVGPNWQWPQRPMAHFMLRSIETIDAVGRQHRHRRSAFTREAHHHFRSANQGQRRRAGSKAAARDELRHDADIAAPIGVGVVDRHLDVDIEAPAPLLRVRDDRACLRGIAAAKQDDDAAIARAVGEDFVDRRAQRRETEAAGHDDDVGSFGLLDRPARPERSAQSDDRARRELGDRAADGTDIADGVHEGVLPSVAAHADRDFADAEGVEHVELPRRERRPRTRQRSQIERHGIGAVRGCTRSTR